jgi:beta-aspartyl-peptidase (threonine type)
LLSAIARGAEILRQGGAALDAVVTAVASLEDDPLFNAGYGSVLTTEGRVEMDAAVMVAERTAASVTACQGPSGKVAPLLRAGGVVLVSRVRNPVLAARAVMERTPHVLFGGAAAERLARQAGLSMCRPEQLVSPRARERWLALMEGRRAAASPDRHGTVGAVAVDVHGNLAAATSTGGVAGKLPGRIGDSAIIGAGLFADGAGAASATGGGEAIMKVALCREAVLALTRMRPQEAARHEIASMFSQTSGEAGVVLIGADGRFGYAHNAHAMEVAMFDAIGVRYLLVERI